VVRDNKPSRYIKPAMLVKGRVAKNEKTSEISKDSGIRTPFGG
jgi:hypothetical protein